jgi:hypothetical protein
MKKALLLIMLLIPFAGCHIDRDTRKVIVEHCNSMSPADWSKFLAKMSPEGRKLAEVFTGRPAN